MSLLKLARYGRTISQVREGYRATLRGQPGLTKDVGGYVRAMLETRGITFRLGSSGTQFSGQCGDALVRLRE